MRRRRGERSVNSCQYHQRGSRLCSSPLSAGIGSSCPYPSSAFVLQGATAASARLQLPKLLAGAASSTSPTASALGEVPPKHFFLEITRQTSRLHAPYETWNPAKSHGTQRQVLQQRVQSPVQRRCWCRRRWCGEPRFVTRSSSPRDHCQAPHLFSVHGPTRDLTPSLLHHLCSRLPHVSGNQIHSTSHASGRSGKATAAASHDSERGITRCVSEWDPPKAATPILVTESGIVSLRSDLQSLNAL